METKLFSDRIKNKKIFFFTGSGICYDSGLASANDVVMETCNRYLSGMDNYAERVRRIIESVQPEIFYSTMLEIFEDESVLDAWKCMSLEEEYCRTIKVKPNWVHMYIVAYSYQAKKPIITLNFDSMFEAACTELGIAFKVLYFNDSPDNILEGFDGVYICKLHGGVRDMGSKVDLSLIKTTMQDITKINTQWLNYIKMLLEDTSICFAGYSGRDIDFFTVFVGWYNDKSNDLLDECFWFEEYDEKTILNASKLDAMVTGQYLSKYVRDNLEDIEKDEYKIIIKNSIGLGPIKLNAGIKHLAFNKIRKSSLSGNSFNSELLWIRLLHITGKNREANEEANVLYKKVKDTMSADEKVLIIIDILMMTNRELARFSDYCRYAKIMCDLSKHKNDSYWKLNGKLQIVSSYHMEIPYNLPFLSIKERHLGLLMIVRFRYMFLRVHFHNKMDLDGVLFIYHELLVRQYSIDVVFLTGLYRLFYGRGKVYDVSITLYRNSLVKRFEKIKREAWEKGNYFSLIGTEKYLYRLINLIDKNNKNVDTRKAEVLKDNSAIAISERDAMIIDCDNIDEHFRKSLEAAIDNDNTYNIVKAYLNKASAKAGGGYKVIDEKYDIRNFLTENEFMSMEKEINKIQSPMLQRAFEYITKKRE